jgi:apolipoprotein D and lipocalin family protein
MKIRRVAFAGAVVVVVAMVVLRPAWGAAAAPLPTVAHVDLQRYAGRWFEVARLPLYWERTCASDVTATYTLRPDGTVDVLNRCRKADGATTESHGRAKTEPGDLSNSKLKVTFFWPFYGDYWILDLDPEYRWALVGTPNRKNLWVLSRTPKLDDSVLQRLLGRARELGFVTTGMIFATQTAGQD